MTLRRRLSRYLTLTAIVSSVLAFAVAVVLVRHRVTVQRHATLVKQAEIAAAADLAAGTRVYR
ncbi:MAG TPA: hypothetical protein VKT31_10735, partial [Solirubrobacteraceae bacterium]|nr:hypothetical protein [Solirubrobacteraceae bacterium]